MDIVRDKRDRIGILVANREGNISVFLFIFFFYGHVMTRGFLWSKRNDGRRMGKRKKVGKKNIKKEVD